MPLSIGGVSASKTRKAVAPAVVATCFRQQCNPDKPDGSCVKAALTCFARERILPSGYHVAHLLTAHEGSSDKQVEEKTIAVLDSLDALVASGEAKELTPTSIRQFGEGAVEDVEFIYVSPTSVAQATGSISRLGVSRTPYALRDRGKRIFAPPDWETLAATQ